MKAICYETKGRSHEQNNTPCQDKTDELINSDFACIALADGAGSAKYSHLGAECVTQAITKLLKEKFEEYYAVSLSDQQRVNQEIIDFLKEQLESITKQHTPQNTSTQQNTIISITSTIKHNINNHFKPFSFIGENIDFHKNHSDNKKLFRWINDTNTTKTNCWDIERNIQQFNIDRLSELLSLISQKIKEHEYNKQQLRNYALKNRLKLEGNNNELIASLKQLKDAMQAICEIPINHNTGENYTLKDLASTLLFAAIKDERYFVGHLGDGVIGAWFDDELCVISEPYNGEHANETFFVTMPGAEKVLNMIRGNIQNNSRGKPITAFVLMSDGGADGLYQKKDKKLIPLLQNLINEAKKGEDRTEAIKELLERVKNEKTTDDCSIAILYQDK